jgi:hypothetical protein
MSEGKTPSWKDNRAPYRDVHRLILKPLTGALKRCYVRSNRIRIGGTVLVLILHYIHSSHRMPYGRRPLLMRPQIESSQRALSNDIRGAF